MTIQSYLKRISKNLLRVCLLIPCSECLLAAYHRGLLDFRSFSRFSFNLLSNSMLWDRFGLSLNFFQLIIQSLLFLRILLDNVSKRFNAISESSSHSVFQGLELLISEISTVLVLNLFRGFIEMAIEFTDLKVLSLNLCLDLFLTSHNVINKTICQLFRAARNSLSLIHLTLKILHTLLNFPFIVNLVFNIVDLDLNFIKPFVHCTFQILLTGR